MASRSVVADVESILAGEKREIGILLARKEVTITKASYSPGERIAGPHVHHEHADAFYVLEGELTFEIGREAKSTTVSAGGFVAVPPLVAHSCRNSGDRRARWLTIHAHDGGFAAFIRGLGDGDEVAWDISAVPAAGGLPASDAIISPGGALSDSGQEHCYVRCALPELRVVEWQLAKPADLTFHGRSPSVDLLFVIEGELQMILARTARAVGPGTLISVPRGLACTIQHRRPGRARMLGLQTPTSFSAELELPRSARLSA
jgi:quercetin dioxygenase-like cupin family protein